jgi:putative membrane protein
MSQDQTENEGGGMKHALNKAADMVGGMVGMASASTAGAHDSAAFVMNAGISDLYEIEAANLAMRRAQSESVRNFAEMMVEHHTTAMHQMQSALMSSEVTGPSPELKPIRELDNRREGMIRHLQEAPEDGFDKTYLDQQRAAHQEAATLHRGYAENGDNPQLRSLAVGGLPMIERHLATLQHLAVH